MKKIEIFDPAMCCSTGVCGPSIDPELIRIASVINALKQKGIIVKRHGLSSEPQDFISSKVISDILQKEGAGILPVTLVDGKVAKEKEVDLIVMGTHGRTGLAHVLIGSVAEKVVHHAHCPVLTVKHPQYKFIAP